MQLIKNGLILTIYVHPQSETGISFKEEFIELWVKAPAVRGKANKKVVRKFAEILKLPSSKIQIIRGLKNRRKLILIESQNPLELRDQILKIQSNLETSTQRKHGTQ